MPILPLMVACAAPQGPPVEPLADAFRAIEEAAHRPVEAPPLLEGPPVLIARARLWTGEGPPIDDGWLVLRDGRIAALGPGRPPRVEGARVIDAAGRDVTPGLIDVHSHLGVYPMPGARAHRDGNEATAPVTGGAWAEHAFWPQDPAIERAVAGGVTTIQVLPGSANLVGGRGLVVHMVPARGARAMRLSGAPETVKMACGENPKRVHADKGGPSTRMGNLRTDRAAFAHARRWLEDLARYEDALARGEDDARPPERDPDVETLAGVLRGDFLPQVHCYRADDMLATIALADEFGFAIRAFHHALEAYKIRDVLADRGIAAATWADWWGFKLEAYDGIPENAALVHAAGGRAIIHSDSPEGIQRLNQEVAKAWAAGRDAGLDIAPWEALDWVTANPAWALGVEDEVGRLVRGMRADVVIWSEDPFRVTARAEHVFIDGVEVWNAEEAGEPWSDFELGQDIALSAGGAP